MRNTVTILRKYNLLHYQIQNLFKALNMARMAFHDLIHTCFSLTFSTMLSSFVTFGLATGAS